MILLVEDDDDIREAAADLLRDAGFEVAEAANGREALKKLAQREPDERCELIVLDLMMPVMDGWEFRRRQLADAAAREIPVLIMTGVADATDAQRRLGTAGAITKPFTKQSLVEAVSRLRAA
jgi:CheY-like chemotaxis protein